MMSAAGIRNILIGKIEVMGPPPPELAYVRNGMRGLTKEELAEMPEDYLVAMIDLMLWEREQRGAMA
jgi:hypothetical protein